jgi:DNA-binding MarR family transcriptional regulator
MAEQTSYATLIDKFWESVPPAWRRTRKQIRSIAVEKFQMSEEQFQVLRRIHKGNASVSSLALAIPTSRSSVSKTVDALVRKKLVARLQDLSDRRNIPLALTDEGRLVLDTIFCEAEKWLTAQFDCLNLTETKLLLRGMEILSKVFSNQ